MINVIIGPPCSGKSTYVEKNMKYGDVVIDLDKLYIALGSSKEYDPPKSIKSVAIDARESAIKSCLNNDFESWIIHTNPSKEQIEMYKEHGADITVIDATREECLERCRNDNRPACTEEAIEKYFDFGGTMEKQYEFEIKEAGEKTHEIIAYASTFDRDPDSYGDVVAKGAFSNWIKKMKETGETVPLLFGHRTDDPMMNIGIVTSAEEDEKGLLIHADIDMDNPNGAYAYKLCRERRLRKLSFAYETLDEMEVTLEDGRKANELRELNVYEVSLVPIPANQHATVVEVKEAEILEKYGKQISAKNADELKRAAELIAEAQEIISGLTASDISEEEMPNDEANECSEEQKSEEASSEALKTLIEIALKGI